MKAGGVKDDRGPAGVTSMDEDTNLDDPMRPQGKIIKSLRDTAMMSPTLTFQNFRQSGKESVITDAIMAAKQMKKYYQQQGNQEAAQFVYNLENEIDNFRRGYDGNTQDGDTMDLSDLMRGTLSKIQFQTNPSVAEDLDANQKRVGQLGPTEKVGKKGAVGKLVGANENFINTVDQAVVSEEDEMAEGILDAIKRGVAGAKQFGKDVKDAGKQAWDEEMPKLKQDWKNPIKTAFAEEGEMDEGAHTQQDRDLNPNDYERKATDWSVDPIAAGTDRIHDKVSSMLDRLKKPASKPLDKSKTDLGSTVLDEMDKSQPSAGRDTGPRPGPDKEAKPISKEKMNKDAADVLDKAMSKEHKKEVKEGQDDLDRILQIMNHRR
jgi:hypothetical protein